MTTTDWDECGFWLSAVKRLIKMRQQWGEWCLDPRWIYLASILDLEL